MLNRELNPGMVAAICGVLILGCAAAYFLFNHPWGVPSKPPAVSKTAGPSIPPPLSDDKIRHGPIGSG